MKILAHTSFIGNTGYANHARSFFCALNKIHTVKVRNFPVPSGWKKMSNTPFDNEPYITPEMKDMLILQTLWTGDKSKKDFPMYDYKGDFEPDVHIILMESNHHYYYDDYEGYKIGFCVWESTRFPEQFFNRLDYFDEMWVPTQWQFDSLVDQGYPKEKIRIVTEGVDVDVFKPIDVIPQKNKFTFLHFGRWDYRKSTTEVIKAFGETFKGNPNVELIASVENPYPYDGANSTSERIKKYDADYDNVKYISFTPREEYVKYLQEGDVFISCARSEGWNLPLIEAMSCGIPALYSNWGGQLQFAQGKGVPVNISHLRPANIFDTEMDGEYCEPDFMDLRSKMIDVYSNYDEYRNNALVDSAQIHEEFNWDTVAKRASEILTGKNDVIEKYESDLWSDYYDRFNIPMESSTFAQFCLPHINLSDNKLLDVCCGNGRDSNFFNTNGINTSAFDIHSIDLPGVNFKTLDLEDREHNFSYEDGSFGSVYVRFVLHAVPEILEDYILINTNRVLKDDGLLFIETRSDSGEVSDYADPHYRRLTNVDDLIEKLKNLNFEVEFKHEADGLSIYKGDDPVLIRIIARKKGEIKVEDEDNRVKYLNPIKSKELLFRAKYVLDNNNITFLLLFGTLLGAYRDNGFIMPDTDIDLGLFKDDMGKVGELINEGYFAIYGIHSIKPWRDVGDSFLQFQYKREQLDFYFFQKGIEGSYEIQMNDIHYSIPNEEIDNGLSEIKFLGESFLTVNNVEKYLTRVYGDWKTPRLNSHAPSESAEAQKNETKKSHTPKELKVNFIDGPYVEILDDTEEKYDVEIIDLKTGESVYATKLKSNHWCKADVTSQSNWLVTIDGINNDFHYEERYSPVAEMEDFNDDVFVIGQYINTIDKEETLVSLINQLKEIKVPIILAGHYPVNKEIQKMVDYYLFDKDNPSGGELSKKFWSETEEYKIESTIVTYDYAIWCTMRNAFNFAKYLNKKNIHYIDYDCDIDILQYKSEFMVPLKHFDSSVIMNHIQDSSRKPINECETYVFSIKTDVGLTIFNSIKTKEEYLRINGVDFILERVFYKFLNNTSNKIYNSKYYIMNIYSANMVLDVDSSLICDKEGGLFYYFDVQKPEETFTVIVDYDGTKKEYIIDGGHDFKHLRKGGQHASYRKFLLKIGNYKWGETVRAYHKDEEISNIILDKTFEEFRTLNNITFKNNKRDYYRFDIINALIKKYDYKNYLEIGTQRPANNFDKIDIENKFCVDPVPLGKIDFIGTSDEYFQSIENIDTKFDIVFIDGLHLNEQVDRDIENSLKHLNENGTIVCHDSLPHNEQIQIRDFVGQQAWCGDVWKSIAKLRIERDDLDINVVDTDHGCAIIRRGKNTPFPIKDNELTYDFYSKNKKELMNAISITEFKNRYKGVLNNNLKEKIEKNAPREIKINFIDGPFVEIKDDDEKHYHIEFIDLMTDNVLHQTDLQTNHWTRANKKYYVDWKIRITGIDTDFFYEHEFDVNGRRVLIAFESKSLGDTLAWMPYVEKFRTENNCSVICSTFLNKLFKDQYPNIEFVEPGSTVDNVYALYRVGWFRDENGVDFDKNKTDPKSEPLTKTASDILGLDYVELRPLLPVLSREKKKVVSIAIHATAQCKYWNNPTGWQDVVDHLNSHGYEVNLLSKEEDGYMGNKTPKNVTRPSSNSLEDVIKILQESELFIGLSSGLSWLSWAVGTETILVSGFSEPYTEPLNGVRRVINNDVCHGCFNKYDLDPGDWYWCPVHKDTDRQFECSRTITSESVIEQINLALGL